MFCFGNSCGRVTAERRDVTSFFSFRFLKFDTLQETWESLKVNVASVKSGVLLEVMSEYENMFSFATD